MICQYHTESPLTIPQGYPERLLIYHGGIGRTVFLGCTKITTLFLFAFSSLFIAPTYYYSPTEPNWAAAAGTSPRSSLSHPQTASLNHPPPLVAAGGAVPLLFVAYTAAPFVNYVHIKLPTFARQSREHLLRWAKNIPPSTEIDMTTMRLYGLPRVSRMAVADLREKEKTAFGVANLVRVPARFGGGGKRPWWMGREVTSFYVGLDQRAGREPAVWPSVLEGIRRRRAG